MCPETLAGTAMGTFLYGAPAGSMLPVAGGAANVFAAAPIATSGVLGSGGMLFGSAAATHAVGVLGSAFSYLSPVASMMNQSASMDYQAALYENQAIAARQKAEYDRQVSERNKVILGYQIENTKARGEIAKKQERLRATGMIGKRRSALARSNVVVDEGSAYDLQEDIYDQSIYSQALIDSDTAYEVHGQKLKEQELSQQGVMAIYDGERQAADYRSQASMTRSKKTGMLIEGVGSVADKWFKV